MEPISNSRCDRRKNKRFWTAKNGARFLPRFFVNWRIIKALPILVGALLVSPTVEAEEADHDPHHAYHKNTIGVFAGITGEDRRERAATLGFEYERRFDDLKH